MPIPELQKAVVTRGDATKIARYAGVSESTIGRLLRGERPNPGIETVAKIKAACARIDAERAADTETESSEKTEEKQTESRKSVAATGDRS